MSTPALILATHNQGKIAEMRDLLTDLVPGLDPASIVSASQMGAPEPVEDGLTFAANATIKARALAMATGLPAVADDSGLCVDVLGGAPGIFSARWCGHHGDDDANLDLLLAQIADVADPHRTARFTCAAVLAVPGSPGGTSSPGGPGGAAEPEITVIEHSMHGRLLHARRGEGGFGYDPIFVPEQEDAPGAAGRTTAQMSPAEKNAISHRGQAVRELARVIAAVLDGGPRLWA